MWFHQEMNSIFYVDSDYESLSFNNSKMETEVRTLKQELARTRDALKVATKRCRDLVRELDSRTAGHESERCLRDQQLSRILRALLVLESRLKQEQKSIRQLLCEKDNVIRNQQLEIAKLRRYTKNYIKCKREQNRTCNHQNLTESSPCANCENLPDNNCCLGSSTTSHDLRMDQIDNIDVIQNSELGKDIQRLKREIIDKLNVRESDEDSTTRDHRHRREQLPSCGVRKTNSFAGSDVSKESCASSSENTDAGSILTTTTDESSPSLLSTEGFCEGESTDGSPGSTLNKSSLKSSKSSFGIGISRRTAEERDNKIETATRMILNDMRDREESNSDDGFAKRRHGIVRAEPLEIYGSGVETKVTMARSESKDDGMDCNFASDDENEDLNHEPIYVNSCNENNARNLRKCRKKTDEDDGGDKIKSGKDHCFDNNNESSKLEHEEPSVEETSGNWYSDPDEDRISDDVFRHSTYRPNGNHNSVLECVNQILLRDMEEEESMLTAPRRFKHRGRIVRFQPARLSDIESVGSEMERRNSEDGTMERDLGNETETGNFEATASEDEFGMRIDQDQESRPATESLRSETSPDNETEEEPAVAIPIIVIEPKTERIEAARRISTSCLEIGNQRIRLPHRSTSPTLRMERIEEKACLQMSSKGLTIAKNLDYEDIESLPEIVSPTPKTPPALPPKPTQFRNTLILKKIPSPSFLIDETRRKHPHRKIDVETSKRSSRGISSCVTPTKTSSNGLSARSLVFEEKHSPAKSNNENANNFGERSSRFNGVRSSFQAFINDSSRNTNSESAIPRVTNMVRHFEEFKIGGDNDEINLSRERPRSKERRAAAQTEFDDFDIRQNFEEFNLDDCDLSDDPDRPEGDGSERLVNGAALHHSSLNENANVNADNNNVIYNTTRSNNSNGIYDNFLEATGLSNKSILTPSRLLSNHKSMLKPKDVKYKNKIKASAIVEKHGSQTGSSQFTHVRHWTGPFV